MRWRHPIFTALISTLIALAAAADEAGISVRDAWVRETPPGMAMTAGYMVLQNKTSRPQVLVAASSSAFETVTIHRTVARQGGHGALPGNRTLAQCESAFCAGRVPPDAAEPETDAARRGPG